jgi:ribokinase
MPARRAASAAGRPGHAGGHDGAGDCWCGVLAASLDRGLGVEAAMRRAAAAAAIACTRPGAAAAVPMATETDALLGPAG